MPALRSDRILDTAQRVLDYLQNEVAEDDRVTVGSVVVLVEMKRKNEDGIINSEIYTAGDDDRTWLHKAMLEEALEEMIWGSVEQDGGEE